MATIKKEQTNEAKQPLTIKATTLVLVGVTLLIGVTAGWNFSSAYHQTVQEEAAVLTQSFTKN